MRSSGDLASRVVRLAVWCAAGCASAGVQTGPPDATAPPSHGLELELVERILAVVDDRPLLLSDVHALAMVRGLSLETALEAAIDERLMYAEASRVAQAEVSPDQESQALAALLAKTPAARTSVPEPDLRRLLRRQLAILQYIEFRFRPQIHVGDEDVRKAWEREDVGRPAGPALEDAAVAIRSDLERRALDERIEAWVRELRSRADVRYVGGTPASVQR
jgi:hypothetical protein